MSILKTLVLKMFVSTLGIRLTSPLTTTVKTMNKFIKLNVRIPRSNIVITEDHNDINAAMDQGDLLAKSLGGNWSLTFNNNNIKL